MFQSRSTLTLVYSLQLLVKFKTLKFISIYRVIRLYFSANETKMCNVGNLLKADIKGIQATTVDVFLCLFLLVLNTFSTFNGYLPPDVPKRILHTVHTLLYIVSIKYMRILHKVHVLQKVGGR